MPIAGVTVAMVLIPQSMAYAQLAGMPPYYGLYAAFLPVIVGALWGSSRQLSTGPVAMVSLLTGSTLAQFAAPGTEAFIALAIVLALMVGVMQLAIGLFTARRDRELPLAPGGRRLHQRRRASSSRCRS